MASQAIDLGHIKSARAAAKVYKVSKDTLKRRRDGVSARQDCTPNRKNLTVLEEQTIIEHALDVDMRGFQLNLNMLRDMANNLLRDRDQPPVGINWPNRFIHRVPELKLRVNRKYDHKRALCEDATAIQAWFNLVQNMKAKYGILDEDTYNFDETGFQMGVIGPRLVITGTERRQAPKTIKPGNTEWVTAIIAANAQGRAIPPFVIMKGAQYYDTWFEELLDRPEWVLSVSEKGWTSDIHGFQWIQHFNNHTGSRTTGKYRLLIMDGHSSHETIEFRQYCNNQNIIPLCMPPHSSHLLQPMDVGCFGPLKKAYSEQIENLVRCGVNHITKEEFLPAFKAAFKSAISYSNIQGGFRGAGLVPFNPDAVLQKLDVRLRTPTPPLPAIPTTWESQTPRNCTDLEFQAAYLRHRIQNHQNSSPTSILGSLNSLEKGAKMMVYGASIVRSEVGKLRAVNTLLSKRKQRKRRVISTGITVAISEGLQLAASLQNPAVIDRKAVSSGETKRQQRRCGRCRQPGHRVETCRVPQIDAPITQDNVDITT